MSGSSLLPLIVSCSHNGGNAKVDLGIYRFKSCHNRQTRHPLVREAAIPQDEIFRKVTLQYESGCP